MKVLRSKGTRRNIYVQRSKAQRAYGFHVSGSVFFCSDRTSNIISMSNLETNLITKSLEQINIADRPIVLLFGKNFKMSSPNITIV